MSYNAKFFNMKIDMHEMLKQIWESFAIQGEFDLFLKILDMDLWI